jgi:hypothetical protein
LRTSQLSFSAIIFNQFGLSVQDHFTKMATERDNSSPLSSPEVNEPRHDEQQDDGSGVPLSTISASCH